MRCDTWFRGWAWVTAGLLMGGCASGPDRVDAELGNAVRSMIAAQRCGPPPGNPGFNGEGIDGVKAGRGYRAYQGVKEGKGREPLRIELMPPQPK